MVPLKFWYRYSYEGHQYRVPLDTEDEGKALTKALKIRANPLQAGANPLAEELENYLAEKREDGTYTHHTEENPSIRANHEVTPFTGPWQVWRSGRKTPPNFRPRGKWSCGQTLTKTGSNKCGSEKAWAK